MWMKVDDQLHAHRKTRVLTRSHATKGKDAAPMGLWVLAGSWAAQNGTDGWVPEDELDRWDDDWIVLVERLVAAGWWKAQKRNGEHGYLFKDWHDYNDPADMASKAGTYGNHVRWHVNEGKVDPDCDHCPKEPDRGDIGGRSGGDSLPDSGGESQLGSGAIALPEPVPNPNPSRTRETASPERFDEFWDTYSHKVGRKNAETAYRAALKKPGITPDLLIAAAAAYITWQMSEGKHPQFTKHAATWLHGEHWRDERPPRAAPLTNTQQHLALVHQLGGDGPSPFQIGGPA